MIGSLAQGLIGVIVDEVAAQGGRRMQQQREGDTSFQHHHDGQYQPQLQYMQQQRQQHQQQLPPGPLASFVESVMMVVNRAIAAAVTVSGYFIFVHPCAVLEWDSGYLHG